MSEQRENYQAGGIDNPRAGTDKKPLLNTFEEVNAIVQNFAAEVFKRFGSGDNEAFMAWAVQEARDWNAVFIGSGREDRPYITDPAWNTPDALGHRALLIMGIDGEHRNGVRDVFMVLADRLTDIAAEAEDATFEAEKWRVAAEIERAAHALLGLPFDPS